MNSFYNIEQEAQLLQGNCMMLFVSCNLSTGAQFYEKAHLESCAVGE